MKFSRLIFATLLVFALSTTFIFVNQTDRDPRFQITNVSPQDVNVSVARGEKTRDLGVIAAGSQISLTARNEASMVFTVRYADGRQTESKPIYFTSGVLVNISISNESIEVERKSEPE